MARLNDNLPTSHHQTPNEFGLTISGQPLELPGIEDAAGLFINTLPLRVRLDSVATVAYWLRGLQQRTVELRVREFHALVEIPKLRELSLTPILHRP